jgi:hypothetical protein
MSAPLTAVAVVVSLSPLELSPLVVCLGNAQAVAAVVTVVSAPGSIRVIPSVFPEMLDLR